MFENIIFPLEFRKYQNEILELFDEKAKKGEKKFHFVAPPGAGKTILGLELFRRIGKKAVVFSPNSAIQAQWKEKLKNLTDKISVATQFDSGADLLSLTYQSITVKDSKTGELHENSKNLIENLKERKVIILDEAHHLVSFWAEVIKKLSDENTIIIGLTATPPIHREQKAINTYLDLIDEVDYQITLPAVVKEGNLAPFQDLVYLIEPTENEMEAIESSSKKHKELMAELLALKPPLVSIDIWAQQRLEKYKDAKGKVIPFDEILAKKPDLMIALGRFVNKEFGELPLSVILLDEMEETPTLIDIIRILEDYAIGYLIAQKKKELFEKVKASLKELGYQLNRNGVQKLSTGLSTLLGLSQNKMIALKEILIQEMNLMQDALRVLVLTDYDMGIHPEGTSATQVMRILTSDERVDVIDPILVTGSKVLVDDDLLPLFLETAREWIHERNLNIELETEAIEGFYQVKGIGADWSTKNYVMMITAMLELGITRCLVGTRSLLGEGWDSVKLNTLIDLTLVSTYVSVNQIRGRSIRKNPDDEFKVANNWDIVCIAPGERGLFDYNRFFEKHHQFYGISDDGVIEKGIGHVHPLLTNISKAELFLKKDEINQSMMSRCLNRYQIRKDWKVGEPYENKETISMNIIPVQNIEKKSEKVKIPVKQVENWNHYELDLEKLENKFSKITKILIANFLVFAILFVAYYPIILLIEAALIGILIPLVKSFKKKKSYRLKEHLVKNLEKGEGLKEVLKLLCSLVFKSMKELSIIEEKITKEQIEIIVREDNSFRILLHGSKVSDIFSRSVAEILSPIQAQKYIIEFSQLKIPGNLSEKDDFIKEYQVSNYYPVPNYFCENRKKADVFAQLWNEIISPGELFYTRRGEGKKILTAQFRKKNIQVKTREKEIWV